MECWPGITETDCFALEKICMEQRTIQSIENYFAFPDGSQDWFKLTIQPVPEGIAIYSENISARKQIEEETQQLNQYLEAQVEARSREFINLYNQAPCGYHSLSKDGTILQVNQTELALLGYAEEDYVGHKITEFMTPESVAIFRKNFPEFYRPNVFVIWNLTLSVKTALFFPF